MKSPESWMAKAGRIFRFLFSMIEEERLAEPAYEAIEVPKIRHPIGK